MGGLVVVGGCEGKGKRGMGIEALGLKRTRALKYNCLCAGKRRSVDSFPDEESVEEELGKGRTVEDTSFAILLDLLCGATLNSVQGSVVFSNLVLRLDLLVESISLHLRMRAGFLGARSGRLIPFA